MVYIIILNWNGWQDTIECLRSVFLNNYPNYHVILCDNYSEDNSLKHTKNWADIHGHSYVEYNEKYAETGGSINDSEVDLILFQNGHNLGFAGGNNVGIKYALSKNDFDFIWLLNNDTVIDKDSLSNMVIRAMKETNVGICGSTLIYYHTPDKVQAYGGAKYNKWLGIPKHIGVMESFDKKVNVLKIEKKIKYIVGASMLVGKEFLKEVGLMNEEYFLYYEELDWAVRSKNKYRLLYVYNSIVYHKEGKSIGTNSINKHEKSLKSDYFFYKNKIVFTKKYYPYCLPTIYFSLLIAIINRIRRGQWERVKLLWKIIWKT